MLPSNRKVKTEKKKKKKFKEKSSDTSHENKCTANEARRSSKSHKYHPKDNLRKKHPLDRLSGDEDTNRDKSWRREDSRESRMNNSVRSPIHNRRHKSRSKEIDLRRTLDAGRNRDRNQRSRSKDKNRRSRSKEKDKDRIRNKSRNSRSRDRDKNRRSRSREKD